MEIPIGERNEVVDLKRMEKDEEELIVGMEEYVATDILMSNSEEISLGYR